MNLFFITPVCIAASGQTSVTSKNKGALFRKLKIAPKKPLLNGVDTA